MIPCMQWIISWPYQANQIFIAGSKVQQKIGDLEVLVDHLADTRYNQLTA